MDVINDVALMAQTNECLLLPSPIILKVQNFLSQIVIVMA